MPVGFNSPARNLFLLGSSGAQVVTNFFKTIDQSAGSDQVYLPDEIKYNDVDQKFVLAGSASDSQVKGFGWLEKRQEDGTQDWGVRVESTQSGVNTKLRALHLDSNDNLIVVGGVGDIPWIAKYSNGGVIDWQSTTNSANVEYTGVTSDSNGNYYACGLTPSSGDAQAFVEKFDANGNPGWGKSAFMLGRDVVLEKIAANDRGEVVAVGLLQDDEAYKGYIVKIDTNTGEVLWDRTLRSYEDNVTFGYTPVFCEDVFIDSKDQIYIVGRYYGISESRGFIVKYTAEGNMIWQKETPVGENIEYYEVKSDGETEQTIVFGRYFDSVQNDWGGILSKYSKNGDLVWRRTLFSSYNNSDTFGQAGGKGICLDADPSFYYLMYIDDAIDELNGTPESYTFGKVSSSGNGLGGFEYAEGTGETLYYDILNIQDKIGRLSDGSVRNDTSDLITYPFNANNLLFDDLATHVSNKKRQMDGPDSFEYSGSPAIRPADFQELNLLGDNVSGRIWNDTSGKGNNGVASLTEPFFGAGGAKFDGPTNGSSTSTSNLVVPSSSDFQFGTGDFTIETWVYGSDWTGGASNQDQVIYYHNEEVSGFYLQAGSLYYYNVSAGPLISGPTLQDKRWYHLAAVRNSGTTTLYVDGVSVGSASDTDDYGVSAITIGKNSGNNLNQFNGYLSNFRIAKGTALYTSNFTPPTTQLTNIPGTVLLTCQGDSIVDNSPSANSITITSVTPTDDGPTHNAAGYWEFDGVDDYMSIDLPAPASTPFTFEFWINPDVDNPVGLFDTAPGQQEVIRNYNTGEVEWWNDDPNVILGLTAGNWYHLVFEFSYTTQRVVKYYRNGSLISTSTGTSDPVFAWTNFTLGNINGGTAGWYDGKLGEFRFYERALTAAQVFQNYNATKSKYINEAPDTAPKIGPGIVYDSNLLLNYDFGNRATYDILENLFQNSNLLQATSTSFPTGWGGWNPATFLDMPHLNGPFGDKSVKVVAHGAVNQNGGGLRGDMTGLVAGATYTVSAYVRKISEEELAYWNANNDLGLTTGTANGAQDVPWFAATRCRWDMQNPSGTGDSPAAQITLTDQWQRLERDFPASSDGNKRIILNSNVSDTGTGNEDGGGVFLIAALQLERKYNTLYGGNNKAGIWFATGVGQTVPAPTTVKNLSSSSYTGTISGPVFDSAGYFQFGQSTTSAITNASFDYDDTTNPNFTVEAWIWGDNWSSNGTSYNAIMNRSDGNHIFSVFIASSTGDLGAEGEMASWRFDSGGGNTQYASSGSGDNALILSTGVWNHCVWVWKDGTGYIYYLNNSSNSNHVTFATGRKDSTSAFTIGRWQNTQYQLDGRIGEIRFYNRELSFEEVSQNFNATRGKYGV